MNMDIQQSSKITLPLDDLLYILKDKISTLIIREFTEEEILNFAFMKIKHSHTDQDNYNISDVFRNTFPSWLDDNTKNDELEKLLEIFNITVDHLNMALTRIGFLDQVPNEQKTHYKPIIMNDTVFLIYVKDATYL